MLIKTASPYLQWTVKLYNSLSNHVKVKWSRYRPSVAQRVGRGIALLFHDRGTRGGWLVSSTLRPQFNPGKDPVPILQEAWWTPGPVWTGGKSRPHRDSIPDRPVRSLSLYQLSYRAHTLHSTSWNSTILSPTRRIVFFFFSTISNNIFHKTLNEINWTDELTSCFFKLLLYIIFHLSWGLPSDLFRSHFPT